MRLFILLGCLLPLWSLAQPQDVYQDNKTLTYDQTIAAYQELADKFPEAKLMTYGSTDIGKPLHLFVLSGDGDFNPEALRMKQKTVLLINNGIHPGEPCGVDACVKLSRDVLSNVDGRGKLLENTVVAIIPIYNVGGSLNRNCCSRANQNGPESYGFRGNARNLDLNRDFIKCDSRNAQAFTEIFQAWNPDVFVDTHTSNGADYQHTMTLIPTQPDKLHPELASYMREKMLPALYSKMKENGEPMVPYVHSLGRTPDTGIKDFLETPRYSTGYTALFHTIGFVTETHMLKTFQARVESTYLFLEQLLEVMEADRKLILEKRKRANQLATDQMRFDLRWELDTTRLDSITFRGYEAKYRTSAVTGNQQLYYDREAPWEKNIPYFNYYKATTSVDRPIYYVVPQSWQGVIDRLNWNKVKMYRLEKDLKVTGEVYRIEDYYSPKQPYEGHYLHRTVEVSRNEEEVQFFEGDYVVPVNQTCNRYIVETLEPEAVDSYFAWNFFDEILQQKEWFSDYVFDPEAEQMIASNPELKAQLEEMKKENPALKENTFGQLYFLYKQSSHYEPNHKRYPVVRITQPVELPMR